ncbi:MAG: hypothetical protein ACU843_15155 [Gammaproteobacteria bacterium]
MYTLSIDIDLAPLQQEILSKAASEVTQGIRKTAELGAAMWRERVMGAKLWEGEKKAYIEAIKWEMDGPLAAEIYVDDREFDLAGEIEKGRPEKDLKSMLRTSHKIRISASKKHRGQRYLIIPFRHNTPGNSAHASAMPDEVYAQAKSLKATRLLSPGSVNAPTRVSGSGHVVAKHSYSWGGRLKTGLVEKQKSNHSTDIYAGMVRTDTSSGKQKSSTYLTFRVMGEWSDGWVVAPRSGLFIAKQVAEDLKPVLSKTMDKAVELFRSAA